jgi:ATP-dependent Clp protease ATP-binding subunit ClpB
MFDLNRLTTQAQDAFVDAQTLLKRYEQNQLDDEHLLLAMLENDKGLVVKILSKLNVDVADMRRDLETTLAKRPRATVSSLESGQVYITPRMKKLMDEAAVEAERLKDEYISTEHILLAMVETGGEVSDLLRRANITKNNIYAILKDIRGGKKVDSQNAGTITSRWKNTAAI